MAEKIKRKQTSSAFLFAEKLFCLILTRTIFGIWDAGYGMIRHEEKIVKSNLKLENSAYFPHKNANMDVRASKDEKLISCISYASK